MSSADWAAVVIVGVIAVLLGAITFVALWSSPSKAATPPPTPNMRPAAWRDLIVPATPNPPPAQSETEAAWEDVQRVLGDDPTDNPEAWADAPHGYVKDLYDPHFWMAEFADIATSDAMADLAATFAEIATYEET